MRISKPIGLLLLRKDRKSILERFFSNVDKFMKNNGRVLVLLNKMEVDWYKELIPKKFSIGMLRSPIKYDDHLVLRLTLKK